jgi:hypothetical protein
VTLINTKGMAFFGPGSEWFWAALQFIALAITFVAIYRQVRIARSARAVEQVAEYTRQFEDERMLRYQLAILVAIRSGVAIPQAAGTAVGNYFETLGSLSRSGHLDIKLLWSLFELVTVLWWTVFEVDTYVQRQRVQQGDAVFQEFEWLVGVMTKMNRRASRIATLEAAPNAEWVEVKIKSLQDAIGVEQALRRVTIAPPDGLEVTQSAVTAPAPAPSRTAEDEQGHRSE